MPTSFEKMQNRGKQKKKRKKNCTWLISWDAILTGIIHFLSWKQKTAEQHFKKKKNSQTTQWSLYEFFSALFILQLTIGYCRCAVLCCVCYIYGNERINEWNENERTNRRTKRIVWHVFCIFKRIRSNGIPCSNKRDKLCEFGSRAKHALIIK